MYIARQPIFNKNLHVYGYELLYRPSDRASGFSGATQQGATASVLSGLFEVGIQRITGGKKAFVNFDASVLLSDSLLLIEPDSLVIEVLEHVEYDDALLARLVELKKLGYQIALDDYISNHDDYPLFPISEIIKYDFMETPPHSIGQSVREALSRNKILLAEKVETREDFRIAVEMGFSLFQGYFFSKPSIIAGVPDKKNNHFIHQQVLKQLQEENPSYEELERIIGTDAELSYRVMRAAGIGSKVRTLKNALVKMGFQELERWIYVLMLQDFSKGKPRELIRLSLVRSRFGELIAASSILVSRKKEIALMCLFSILDAMLDRPMNEALAEIDVSQDVRELLIHQRGELRPIYDIITRYEKGNCNLLHQYSYSLSINESKLFDWYIESIRWADQVLKIILTEETQ